jgi:hypothetical protein
VPIAGCTAPQGAARLSPGAGRECIHPRRARCFAQSLRTSPCGIFAGYSAFESRFNQSLESVRECPDLGFCTRGPNGVRTRVSTLRG